MAQFNKYRLVYLFGRETVPQMVEQQIDSLMKFSKGFKERDLELVTVESTNSLSERFKVTPGIFTLILIGKDGSEKYRTNKVIKAATLFAIIDAMPMRKAEMKSKN